MAYLTEADREELPDGVCRRGVDRRPKSSQSADEFGLVDQTEEHWINESGVHERHDQGVDIEALGRIVLSARTSERAMVNVESGLFSTQDLEHTWDLTRFEDREPATTRSE
jgi:hypothetical protein